MYSYYDNSYYDESYYTKTSTTPATPIASPTATQKNLSKYPQACHLLHEHLTLYRDAEVYESKGTTMLEIEGLQSALSYVCCKDCGTGSITVFILYQV